MQALRNQGVQLQIGSELGEFTTMLALVSAGLGIGLLPANAGRALPANVVSRPLELDDYRATTGLAWVDLNSAVKQTVFNLINDML
jgi:DNA-binding transcriptional LysR family regulator